jgi:hypothetical protein
MNYHDNLNALAAKLEKENPGKTIVLDASTLETVIISDDPLAVREAVVKMGDAIPVFMGGPNTEPLCFHHMPC